MKSRALRLTLFFVPLFLIPIISNSKTLNERVILISFDGVGLEKLMGYMSEPGWPDFGVKELISTGLSPSSTIATNPTLTASSHTSIHTGTYADEHGVVSNYYHLPRTMIDQGVSGFSSEFNRPAIWERAMAAGKRVGILSFPGADNESENQRRKGDFGIRYHSKEANAFLFRSTNSQFFPILNWDASLSYSQPKAVPVVFKEEVINENGLVVESERTIYLIALDLVDDNDTNYNALIWDNDQDMTNGTIGQPFRVNEWGQVSFTTKGVKKATWTKIFKLESDLSEIKVYIGTVHHTEAYPESFAREIEGKVGIWPGEPDSGVGRLIDQKTWLEQAYRLSNFFYDLLQYVAENKEWDLLLAYQPIVDEFGHAFTPPQPDTAGFQSALIKDEALMKNAYLHFNELIRKIIAIRDNNTNLVVVSDHGMAPIHTMAYPNRFLKSIGFINAEDDSGIHSTDEHTMKTQFIIKEKEPTGIYERIIEIPFTHYRTFTPSLFEKQNAYKGTTARAFASGGLAHVYLNVKGREELGIVEPGEEYDRLLNELKEKFENWVSNGKPVFSYVLKRSESSQLRLNHENSGDLILIARPGIHLQNILGGGPLIEPASFQGQHGYDAALSSMKPVVFAAGPGVQNKQVPLLKTVDVSPMVLHLLGIEGEKNFLLSQ
ncbi:MAG: hypothetical protein A3F16_00850 [Deltaproteobacteria bacterium RIFCSPHIGHO2_12_FULL_43_9]|nr:MAG: hypothetical protein A3F16_00850 [Deltaproteobacteria bacterium RIFCSPHIGHO2_12_FULL_43_9]